MQILSLGQPSGLNRGCIDSTHGFYSLLSPQLLPTSCLAGGLFLEQSGSAEGIAGKMEEVVQFGE